jgi:hypothetical protein
LPPVPVPPSIEFQRLLYCFLRDTIDPNVQFSISNLILDLSSAKQTPIPSMEQTIVESQPGHPGLKKHPPYWFPYATMAKGRWLGREILEVVSTEFRDRSMEYYVRMQ